MNCPRCQTNWKQYKAGFNPSGSQRYRCGECNRVYTPEHGSWLNMAEIELSALVRQCLDQRIPDIQTLAQEV